MFGIGIATDGTSLYVADTFNNRIEKRLASDLSLVATIGTLGSGASKWVDPRGVAADGTDVLVVDSNNSCVVELGLGATSPPSASPLLITGGSSASPGGPFTTATTVVQPGQSVTWQFRAAALVTRETAQVFVARRMGTTVWQGFQQVGTALFDDGGTAAYATSFDSVAWVSVRIIIHAGPGHAAAWSPALQAAWRWSGRFREPGRAPAAPGVPQRRLSDDAPRAAQRGAPSARWRRVRSSFLAMAVRPAGRLLIPYCGGSRWHRTARARTVL